MNLFSSSELPEDLTLRQVKGVMTLSDMVNHASAMHAMVILQDGIANHDCGHIELNDDILDEAPKMDAEDVQLYLALEQALMTTMSTVRASLIHQGYPVEREVPTSLD